MNEFVISPEFRDKIPPLTADEFKRLEENIVADGEVREPLIVWNNTLIDGHHRWQIIQKHPEIPYRVREMDFADKWAAISWMCSNQLGRRNITNEQKAYILGKLYEARKNTNGGNRGNQYTKMAKPENLEVPSRKGISQEIADEQGVSHDTVEKAAEFSKGLDKADEVAPGFRKDILDGNVKAPKKAIQALRKLDGEELKQAVEELKKPKEERRPKTERKPKAASEEEAKALEEIAASIAIMTDVNREITYDVNSLAEDIVENGKSYVKLLRRTIEMRRTIAESDPVYIRQLIDDIISDIEKIKEGI